MPELTALIARYEYKIELLKKSIIEYTNMNENGTWNFMINDQKTRLQENENFLKDLHILQFSK